MVYGQIIIFQIFKMLRGFKGRWIKTTAIVPLAQLVERWSYEPKVMVSYIFACCFDIAKSNHFFLFFYPQGSSPIWNIFFCCDARAVKGVDLKSTGIFPRRFESCSQRGTSWSNPIFLTIFNEMALVKVYPLFF